MNAKKNYIYHIIAILVVGIWGLTFISTKVLIGYGLSPQEIFLLRFLMAYLGIWFISPRKLFADNWKDELWLLSGGVTGGSFYFLTENDAIRSLTEYIGLPDKPAAYGGHQAHDDSEDDNHCFQCPIFLFLHESENGPLEARSPSFLWQGLDPFGILLILPSDTFQRLHSS